MSENVNMPYKAKKAANAAAPCKALQSYKTSLSLTSAVAIAGVGIVRLSDYKALFGFPTYLAICANNACRNSRIVRVPDPLARHFSLFSFAHPSTA